MGTTATILLLAAGCALPPTGEHAEGRERVVRVVDGDSAS